MKLGIIETGVLKGKRVILSPREGMEDNIYLVEKGMFINGAPTFAKYCLNEGCEQEVPNKCNKCNH